MKKGIAILFITCLMGLFSCGGEKYEWTFETRFTLEHVQDDFEYMRDLIFMYHPKTFTDMTEFAQIANSQYALLTDSMTFLDFYRVVGRVTSSVRCGHTRIWPPEEVEIFWHDNGHYLPLDIRVLDDRLYVYKTLTDSIFIKSGAEILTINGDSATAIIDKIKNHLYTDGSNDTYKYYLINHSGDDFKILYMRFVDNSGQYVLTLRELDQAQIKEKTIRGFSRREIWKYTLENDVYPDSSLIITDYHEDYAYLRIRFFDFYDNLDYFKVQMDLFFTQVADRQMQNLILDLRGNDGGDPHSSAYLLRYLINKPIQYFAGGSAYLYGELKKRFYPHDNVYTGDLYVLVDGGCYSTTGHFLSHLKEHNIGIFIGEETGGTYICHGGYEEVQLKHTGIGMLLPRTAYETDVRSLPPGEGIPPNYEIHPTISDLMKSRDPVLYKAISMFRDDE